MEDTYKIPEPHELPEVTARVFKEPNFLNDDPWWYVFDRHRLDDVLQEVRETLQKREIISITDVFYRLRNETIWTYGYSVRSKQVNNKYPCIGGPLNGETAIIGTKNYIAYNIAANPRREWVYPKNIPKNVLVFIDVISKH